MSGRIASWVDRASIRGDGPLYGRDMAVEMFFGALARQRKAGSHQLFYSTAESRAFLEQLQLDAHPIDALFDDFERFPFDAWHDADANLATPARLRAAYSKRLYPITATPHVLSYQGLLHGWILETLLADVRPCDAIVCISRSAKTAIANLLAHVGDRLRMAHGGRYPFRGQLVVLPYSIDTEHFQPRPRKKRDAFVLLWLGRLSAADKGDLVPLLRVFRNLLRAFPTRELQLVIGGTGTPEYVAELRNAARELGIADRVDFRGAVKPEERHLLYASADVFVSPVDNMQETLGNTPLEALASGVPQVVADWDGYRDMIIDGETGFLIPTYWGRVDAEENRRAGIYDGDELRDHFRLAQSVAIDLGVMERALAKLIADDELRSRMAAASRARALSTFSEPVIMHRFDELWTHLAGIAKKLPFTPAAHYATPSYIEHFGHYATELLDENTKVIATGEPLRAPHPDLGLDMNVLEEILRNPTLRGVDQRHALWLMKHGMLQRAR